MVRLFLEKLMNFSGIKLLKGNKSSILNILNDKASILEKVKL